MSRTEGLLAGTLALLAFALAAGLRLHQAPVAMALSDSVAPWWTAWSASLQPHAPPYGPLLYLPYALILPIAGSLWEASCAMLALHGLVAPLGVIGALTLRPRAWAAAALVGLGLALDPGLMDTALSGAEGYLGALWLGVCALLLHLPRRWAPGFAWVAFAAAAHNHPLSLCAAPLLALTPRRRDSLPGALAGLALLAPPLLRALGEGAPALGGGAPWEALPAYLDQGGPLAWLLLAGPLLGLLHPRTRPLALASLGSAALMALAGAQLGYLRDHHLRLLSLPFALGWAGLPGAWPLLGLLLLRPPLDQRPPPGHPQRPGTLGLAQQLGSALAALEARPLLIEGVWISASPAAEPSALTLDLLLRGWPSEDLGPGGTVALVVSAEREDLAQVPDGGTRLAWGDRHLLLITDETNVWKVTQSLCVRFKPRIGGAADSLRALSPAQLPALNALACPSPAGP